MKKVIIIGGSENGHILENILKLSGYEVSGFLDDSKTGGNILGKVADFTKFRDQECHFFVGIGSNAPRQKIYLMLKEAGARFINAIHPKATIEAGVKLGKNVMVGAHAYINIRTTVGDNTLINNSCNVDHDNIIGSHCHLAPAAVTGGGVKIGDGTFVGLNVTIRDHKTVGENVIVGMASAVVTDIPDGLTIVGNPAKPIKIRIDSQNR